MLSYFVQTFKNQDAKRLNSDGNQLNKPSSLADESRAIRAPVE